MRIALTGATGYTGGRLLGALLARGDRVTALAREVAASPPTRSSAVDWIQGDLSDRVALGRLVEGADAVLHVAAVYRTAGHPDSYYRDVNVGGTERLARGRGRGGREALRPHVDGGRPRPRGDASRRRDARPSPPATSTRRPRRRPSASPSRSASAGACPWPSSVRARSTGRARRACSSSSVRSPAGGTRSWGTGGRSITRSTSTTSCPGSCSRCERPEAVGQSFIIAGPRYVSQGDLADAIARHTGGRVLPFRVPAAPLQWAGALCEAICVPFGIEPPLHRRRVDFWTKSRAFSIEKARRVLGYDPKVDLEDGIARTVAWYRQAGWL